MSPAPRHGRQNWWRNSAAGWAVAATVVGLVAGALHGVAGGVLGACAIALLAVPLASLALGRGSHNSVLRMSALILGPVLVLLIDGLVLSLLQIKLDHRSVAWSTALIGAVVAIVARRTAADPEPGDLAASVDRATSGAGRGLRRTDLVAGAVILMLGAAAVVVGVVSEKSAQQRGGFVSLALDRVRTLSSSSRSVTVSVRNDASTGTFTVRSSSSTRPVTFEVAAGGRHTNVFVVPRKADVSFMLYRAGDPGHVIRQVNLRATL